MAMDWDKLRVFHAVAEAGSFTHAGESLNLSQSAVSRQISALEESLSVPLFHRHARGLILTEQGELLFRTAREVFAKLAMAEGLISEFEGPPEGPAEDHHDRRVRLDLADAANPRIPRPLSRRSRSASSSTIPSSICRCARPMSRSACRRRASPT